MTFSQSFDSIQDFQEKLNQLEAVLLYFNTNSCSVGEALEPKVLTLIKYNFPKIEFHSININDFPEIASYCSAFVEPTILVFFEGKEYIRKSRNFGIFELEEAIKRPYKLIFE